MAGSMTNYSEAALIDHLLRNTAYTSVATVYLALFTDDPTDAATGTEVTGGSYARESIAFDAAASRTLDNTSDVTFTTATASWGTVTHWGISVFFHLALILLALLFLAFPHLLFHP